MQAAIIANRNEEMILEMLANSLKTNHLGNIDHANSACPREENPYYQGLSYDRQVCALLHSRNVLDLK